jgi:hypothetical protein
MRGGTMQGQHALSNERGALSSAGSRLAQREHPRNMLGAVVGDAGGEGLINSCAGVLPWRPSQIAA